MSRPLLMIVYILLASSYLSELYSASSIVASILLDASLPRIAIGDSGLFIRRPVLNSYMLLAIASYASLRPLIKSLQRLCVSDENIVLVSSVPSLTGDEFDNLTYNDVHDLIFIIYSLIFLISI